MKYTIPNLEKAYLPLSIIVASIILAGAWVYTTAMKDKDIAEEASVLGAEQELSLEEKVIPGQGIVLPVSWGSLGNQMVQSGVIDKEKFESLYANRGGMTQETRALLEGQDNGNLAITLENSGTILNLLWALGLGNKNDILEAGEMANPEYGGAGRFASTGGWTLAKGEAMDHYSRHRFITLAPDQQDMVDRVSKNIYRPCCNNSTHFPDCNHGMAMLGLLELMASQGMSEEEMYKVALQVNSYWFPDTYLTIAQYLNEQGIDWKDADARAVLGLEYSSASGFRQVLNQVQNPQKGDGGSCGV